MKLPIKLYPLTLTTTATGGTSEALGSPINDFAEVKDISANKDNKGGQEEIKRFTIDYRPSLAITQKWLVEFNGIRYTILTIRKEGEQNFKYLVEAKVKK